MTRNQRIANTEVLIVLNKLNLINKIPKEIISFMQKNQEPGWNFVYDDRLPLQNQKLWRMSIIMFSNLYCMYICNNPEEKKQIKATLDNNTQKEREYIKSQLGGVYES